MIWTAAFDPNVLRVAATPSPRGAFDITRLHIVVVIDEHGVEHIAIVRPGGLLRLDVIEGTMLRGPVDLHVQLEITARTPFQLAALDRLLRLGGARDPGRRPASADRRLLRLVEALRVADAVSEGASLADIAAGLAADDRVFIDWPGDGNHLKSAIRRKVALARRLVALGPAGVLNFRT